MLIASRYTEAAITFGLDSTTSGVVKLWIREARSIPESHVCVTIEGDRLRSHENLGCQI